MLASAALVLPVVLLALFYLRRMNEAVGRIAERDIELMHIGDRISLDLARARRDDKNFLLYRDSTFLIDSRDAVGRVSLLADSGRKLDPATVAEFDTIHSLSLRYHQLLDSLRYLPAQPTPAPGALPGMTQLRRSHELLLRQAGEAADSTRRDSLLTEAARLAERITLPTPGSRHLDDELHSLQQQVAALSDTIVARALHRIGDHRQNARRLATWGQRNIVTVLLLTVVVLIWLMVALPRQTVLPIKRLLNALRRAETGNLDIRVKPSSADELGQLAHQLNRSFARLREFDERKVDRILQLERRFRLLSNDISEAVIVVDRATTILLANYAAEELLGRPVAEAKGRKLQTCENLAFIMEPLDRVLAGATTQQTCEVLPELPGTALCIEALRSRAGEISGAMIVIGNPQLPRPAGEDEEGSDKPPSTGEADPPSAPDVPPAGKPV